ncbi:MAG: 50S ribosomal protein L14e [Candidatus Diapherotrites archaeon]|uniref:50S ribosomal protein L14e n=1 Tax=Candidatus Iainarchaeum sp. TaxID=3101447 RepID=A0A8T4KXF6_9ARCH|nr:50S ribosomal protein L14e [Candidatus Diapherotrites archaeon]
MPALEVGRICVKTRGRNAGKRVVVIEMQKNFAVIDAPKMKRKRCNILHLIPLEEKIDVGKSTSHEEIAKLMKK